MTISVVIFALIAGLLIGVVGAVLFIVIAVGFALIILLPTLFLTTAAATFIWLWGLGGYYIIKWFNKKEVPGIHTEMNGSIEDNLKGRLSSITGQRGQQDDTSGGTKEEGDGGAKENGAPKHANRGAKQPHHDVKGGGGKGMNGVGDKLGSAGKSAGVDMGNPKEATDVGKHAGKVTNTAGGAKGAVSGVTGL